jgi:hypothetical protein
LIGEPLKYPFPSREPGLFPILDSSQHSHILQALLQGVAEEIGAFFENFNDGLFQKAFHAAFFECGHWWQIMQAATVSQRRCPSVTLTGSPLLKSTPFTTRIFAFDPLA